MCVCVLEIQHTVSNTPSAASEPLKWICVFCLCWVGAVIHSLYQKHKTTATPPTSSWMTDSSWHQACSLCLSDSISFSRTAQQPPWDLLFTHHQTCQRSGTDTPLYTLPRSLSAESPPHTHTKHWYVDHSVFKVNIQKIWRNSTFHHLLANGSSAVNGCRQCNYWRKQYYGYRTCILARNNGLKLKDLNKVFVSYKQAAFVFSRHQLIDWRGVDYLWNIVMFLSAVWTLILTAPIHCRGSIGELHFSKSNEETNSSTSWMAWGWGRGWTV